MIGIYKITNKLNGYCYIGRSKDIKRRFREHKYNKNIKYQLYYDMQKYGINNFDFDIIEQCEEEKLKERELYYIHKLQPHYNKRGLALTEEEKNKLSKSVKIWWEKLSEETKTRIIKNLKPPLKNHPVSEITREKIRQANLGKKQSQETIEKRMRNVRGKHKDNSSHQKPIICIETGEIFESLKQADEKYHLSTLCGHLKGRYKTCKGKHYKYL